MRLKSKVIVMCEKSSQCEIRLNVKQLEQVSELKYLCYMLDERVCMLQNVVEKVADALKS